MFISHVQDVPCCALLFCKTLRHLRCKCKTAQAYLVQHGLQVQASRISNTPQESNQAMVQEGAIACKACVHTLANIIHLLRTGRHIADRACIAIFLCSNAEAHR